MEEDHGYPQSCPFCTIADAYPASSATSVSHAAAASPELPLDSYVPRSHNSVKVSPSCHLVLSAPEVLAFLDILPMTSGHLLVTTRAHRRKIADLEGGESRDMGFWLPILARTVAKVTGVEDYNVVQNNGIRAAQVVPHVHFHIIPRPEHVPQLKARSWTMFGRGQRDDLDDEEGEKLAAQLRQQLRDEVKMSKPNNKSVKEKL